MPRVPSVALNGIFRLLPSYNALRPKGCKCVKRKEEKRGARFDDRQRQLDKEQKKDRHTAGRPA